MNERGDNSLARAQTTTTAAALIAAAAFGLFWPAAIGLRLLFVASAGAALYFRSFAVLWVIVAGGLFADMLGNVDGVMIHDFFSIRDFIATAALLIFVVFALRDLNLRKRSRWNPRWSDRLSSLSPDVPAATLTAETPPEVRLRPLSGAAIRLPLVFMVAALLLRLLPITRMYPNLPNIVPSIYRGIVFFWGFSIVTIFWMVLFSVFRWRGLLPNAATAHVHRIVADELR